MTGHITGHDEKVGHNDVAYPNHDGSTAASANPTDAVTLDLSMPSPTISTESEATIELPQRRQLYDNLSAGQFRLLRLFATEKHDDIRCCLRTFTAASPDCPSYRAVSYAWGPRTSTTPICISSQGNALQRETTHECHLHSQNLFDLLNQLRSEQSDCWLWIDALCINQDDNGERSQQVKLMGEIFRAANTVLAWLGPFTHVRENQWDDKTGLAQDVETMIQRDHDTHASIRYNQNHPSSTQPVEGQGICALPYWRRRWIVQELLLARSVVLQVREKHFTMAALEKAVKLADGETSTNWHGQNKIASVQNSAAALLARHSLGRRTGSLPQRLKELLVMYKDQECQQSYDLVYAMHSLIDPKYRDHLQVDYKQSAEEQFCVVISFMHEHEDLSIEGVRIAWSLLKDRKPSLIDPFRMLSQGPGLYQSFDMETRVFKLGSAPEIKEESGLSIYARRHVAALSPILLWTLQLKSGSWAFEQRTKPWLASTKFSIGPQDMLFFQIPGTEKWGLAAMAEPQFSTDDEIWLFAHTSYAFIVLPNASGSMTVRGRAALFNPNGTRYIGSELYPYPSPTAEGIKSTAACVEMRLTIPDLIILATMANVAYLH
ncbi:hypothetical protein LTR15_003363 [Elasticomyces elasticus]|nr:hypothetical protein LTR15_003363 [Elasticomyces elasticus]